MQHQRKRAKTDGQGIWMNEWEYSGMFTGGLWVQWAGGPAMKTNPTNGVDLVQGGHHHLLECHFVEILLKWRKTTIYHVLIIHVHGQWWVNSLSTLKFHINPWFKKKFLSSHFLLDFHELYNIKSRNKSVFVSWYNLDTFSCLLCLMI